MVTEKITVHGENDSVLNICDLLSKCTVNADVCDMSLDVYLPLWDREIPLAQKDSMLVVPLEMKEKVPDGVSFVTYSDSDSAADVSSLNVQRRESSVCFELLCGDFMNRVFIPHKEKYTQSQVLVCASILYALGVPLKQAVSLINESLK